MTKKLINSVCVLRLTALGDCINAFGLIQALKATKSIQNIVWVIDSRFAPLFRNEKGEDIIPLVPVDFKKQGLWKSCQNIRHELSSQHFDYLLNLQTSIKASIASLFIKAHTKLGYDHERSREGQALFIDEKVPSPNNPHVLAGFMEFANYLGFDDLRPCWDFKLSENETEPFTKIFGNEKIFSIAPASAKKEKNWTSTGYIELGKYALKEGFKVVLVGSPAQIEIELCKEIETGLEGNCLNYCGKTSLRQMAALISQSTLVLSPDSAAMHLASALSIPVIGLFAIHNPKRVGSWNFPELWVSVYADIAKKELGNKSVPWRYRVKDPKAMEQIEIKTVCATFDRAIQQYNL